MFLPDELVREDIRRKEAGGGSVDAGCDSEAARDGGDAHQEARLLGEEDQGREFEPRISCSAFDLLTKIVRKQLFFLFSLANLTLKNTACLKPLQNLG